MLAQYATLGCTAGDLVCLCKNNSFGYGLRDCSAESCPPGTDLNAISSYGTSQCASGESQNIPTKIGNILTAPSRRGRIQC